MPKKDWEVNIRTGFYLSPCGRGRHERERMAREGHLKISNIRVRVIHMLQNTPHLRMPRGLSHKGRGKVRHLLTY